MFNKHTVVAVGIMVCAMFLMAQANFQPERLCQQRAKKTLDFGWKFTQGDGSYSASSYNDASWKSVNVPHSASYDEPTPTGERSGYQGICWYRKTFTMPDSIKHTGKIFIEFEGAMQSAQVWLNGTKLGIHDNSGYTWFKFDVTNTINLTGANVLAVRLDNTFSGTIPPGCAGASTTIYPDYYLFSGLYRDVWLVSTDKCFIPLYGQQISVAKGPYSAGAPVTIKTKVLNTYTTAKSIKVRHVLAYDEKQLNKGFLIDSATAMVNAGDSITFRRTCSIMNPTLWTTDAPYLYRVFTQVFADGQLVDDYVDRFGVRWYDWTPSAGFSLNGIHTIIKGACLHQSIGWIENALPNSRFKKEVALIKDMGSNLIRCSHFPRDPAFYDACDELGMMSMVEVPTWGTTSVAYPDSFWLRLNNCVKEMIEVGYNHPSIIAWGLFNEPYSSYSAANQIPLMNTTAHTMDSTRMTYMANNAKNTPFIFQADIAGLNYGLDLEGSLYGQAARTLNTEYHEGWLYWCFRGDANDNATATDGYALQRWLRWNSILNYNGANSLAGGCMWSFNDYWSPFMDHPMGVVDNLRIPKAVYYYFRNQWTGKAADYPSTSAVPAKVILTTDADSLFADSTDVAIITAAIRDANGTCVHTGYNPGSKNVTFSINNNAVDYFGSSLTVNAVAGKCALLIKSKNTPGTITITATVAGLPVSDPVTIRIVAPDTSKIPNGFFTPVITKAVTSVSNKITVKEFNDRIQLIFPSLTIAIQQVSLLNIKGQKIECPIDVNGKTMIIDTKQVAAGSYYLAIGNQMSNLSMMKKIIITK